MSTLRVFCQWFLNHRIRNGSVPEQRILILHMCCIRFSIVGFEKIQCRSRKCCFYICFSMYFFIAGIVRIQRQGRKYWFYICFSNGFSIVCSRMCQPWSRKSQLYICFSIVPKWIGFAVIQFRSRTFWFYICFSIVFQWLDSKGFSVGAENVVFTYVFQWFFDCCIRNDSVSEQQLLILRLFFNGFSVLSFEKLQ